MSNPPTPDSQPTSETPDEVDYSGEALLKMPKTLHRKLAEAAEKEGVDLNQYLVALLSEQNAVGKVQHSLDAMSRRMAREESLAYVRERTTPTYSNRYIEDIESGIDD
jgi:hypothetical protein